MGSIIKCVQITWMLHHVGFFSMLIFLFCKEFFRCRWFGLRQVKFDRKKTLRIFSMINLRIYLVYEHGHSNQAYNIWHYRWCCLHPGPHESWLLVSIYHGWSRRHSAWSDCWNILSQVTVVLFCFPTSWSCPPVYVITNPRLVFENDGYAIFKSCQRYDWGLPWNKKLRVANSAYDDC